MEKLELLRNHIQNKDFPPSFEGDFHSYPPPVFGSHFYYYTSPIEKGFPLCFNCYSYALQLDIDLNTSKYFILGYIANRKLEKYNKVRVIDSFLKDCEKLNISACETNIEAENLIDTYKIAIFIKPELLNNFHVIRQNIDGTWSHKPGWYRNPERIELDNDAFNREEWELATVMKLSKKLTN